MGLVPEDVELPFPTISHCLPLCKDDWKEVQACLQLYVVKANITLNLPPVTTLSPPSPASSVSSAHGWEVVSKKPSKGKSRSKAKPSPGQTGSAPMHAPPKGPAALSFVMVAAAANKVVAPLSKAALEKMTHLQAVNTFNACHSQIMGSRTSLKRVSSPAILLIWPNLLVSPTSQVNFPSTLPSGLQLCHLILLLSVGSRRTLWFLPAEFARTSLPLLP